MNKDFIQIVDVAKSGNNKAFEKLYNMTKDSAYFVALSITKNEHDAMDILQDSYIKAFKNLNTLKQPEVFDSWLNRIVANTSKNYITKKKPVLFGDVSNDISGIFDDEEFIDKQNIPHEVVDSKETARLIMEIIDRLSEDKRLIVIMYYYQEMQVKEIAETLELPVTTIKYKLLSARQEMKKDIEGMEKKGTKLYSIAPLAIIPSVLAVCAASCEVPVYASILPAAMAGVGLGSAVGSVGIGSAASSAVTATVATATATTVASSTTAGGIAGFFATVGGKIVATALAVAVVGGGTATAVVMTKDKAHDKNVEISTESSQILNQDITSDIINIETNTTKESETIPEETESETKVVLSNYTKFEDLTKEMPDTSAMIIDIEYGTDYSYDLNNDGKEDNIYYYCEEIDYAEYEVELKINGKDYSDKLESVEPRFERSGSCHLIDIDDSDEYVELAIWGGYNAGDRNTSFFRYNGSDLEYIGRLPEFVPNENGFYADGKGTIYFRKDQSLGTSWPTDAKYILNKEGKIEEVKGWRYYSDEWADIERESHEVIKEVEVYTEPKDDADKIILTKDLGPVKFYITDNDKWVGIINDKNEVYYIKMNDDDDYSYKLENGENISDILKDVRFFG